MSIVRERMARERELLRESNDRLGANERLLSENEKTEVAFNLPLCVSCRPTSVCRRVCYAALPRSRLMWSHVINKNVKRYRYIVENSPETVACRLGEECRVSRTEFLRICDYGDLVPPLVSVINAFARRYPDIRLWVTTRRPEMASHIDRRANNITIWFSLDASKSSQRRQEAMARHRHPLVHYSYLFTDFQRPPPPWVDLVFPQQDLGEVLPIHPRSCPADVPLDRGGIEKRGACQVCRFCSDPSPLPPLELISQRTREAANDAVS